MEHKYNYFYRITNKINGHFYYGVHSTDNLDDGYMGSGTRLKGAYKKYGIENFEKEIVKFCESRKEAYELESSVVTEALIKDNNCYNIILGGEQFNTEFLVAVRDKNGKTLLVHKDDPRYLSGELVGVTKGYFSAIDENGNTMLVKEKSENIHGVNYKKVTVKDSKGKIFLVSVDDPRYLSGELKHVWVGKKHSEETKQKLIKTLKSIGHQQGERNSQYGTCWIHNNEKSIKIKKDELARYELDGWIKGRQMIFNNK